MKNKIAGVSFYKRTGKWKAEVTRKGVHTHIGYYASKNQAAEARALWEMDNPAPPKEPRVKRAKGHSAEPRAQSRERRAESAEPRTAQAPRPVEKPPVGSWLDPNKPVGPENYQRKVVNDDIWKEMRSGEVDWPDRWLAVGDWWQFDRYCRLDVWEAEVQRISDFLLVHETVARDILEKGARDCVLADSSDLREFDGVSHVDDPRFNYDAEWFGVADLV